MSKKRTPARSNVRPKAEEPKKSIQLTTKQIILAVAIVVVAIAAIVLIARLTRGDITRADDNWVVRRERTKNGYLYYKLGETGDIEGFQLQEPSQLTSDALNRTVSYKPVDEDNPIDKISFYYSIYPYAEAAETSMSNLGYAGAILSTGDIVEGEANGMKYSYYTYCLDSSTEENADEKDLGQWLVGYVDAGDSYSALISVFNDCVTQDEFLDEQVLFEAFEKALGALTIEKK